jgi:mannose-1-phosphate guanylyltransferase
MVNIRKIKMNDHFYAVIMAGGGGTRLWPVSRKQSPKQMLRIIGNQSLFQLAVERLRNLFPAERIFVITLAEQAVALHTECPELPLENFLIEPAPRGTASVVGLAASFIKRKDSEGVMAVLTADHIIENKILFQQLLSAAFDIARDNYLVTLGIEPTYPSTGYGYIESGKLLEGKYEISPHEVKRFIEKPDEQKAKQFLSEGGYYWNSGMFIWKVERILEEFDLQMPVLKGTLDLLYSVMGSPGYDELLKKEWPSITPQTIDYGIMENAAQVVVLPAKGLQWSDVGSWDSLLDFLERDDNGNVIIGDKQVTLDTKNSILYQSKSNRLVVTIGLEDIVIIDTKDALLVCKRGETQKVRKIVELLKQSKMQEYL